MIYQLVLVTNLGIITPLVNFATWDECLRERAKIRASQQYSAECLPAQSPEQIQKQIEGSMKMMIDTLNKLSQNQK